MNKKFFNRIISIIVALVFVVSFPLYSFAIVGGTENEYSFTMQDIVDACKSNDINKLNEMAKELVQKEENEEPSIVPLWSSDYNEKNEEDMCHEYITAVGCFWYVGAVAQMGYDISKNGITMDDIRVLTKYSAWPDEKERDIGFQYHFYNPSTGKSWNGSTVTARTRFVYYYGSAVSNYNLSYPTTAFQELGKGLHYIQDVNEPHHAANLIAVLSTHLKFEKYVSIHRDRLFEKLEDSIIGVVVNKNVINMDCGSFLHESAVRSKLYSDAANKAKVDSDINIVDDNWDKVGVATLYHSIYDTASVIYKFMKSTGRI